MNRETWVVDRRDFLKFSAGALAGLALGGATGLPGAEPPRPALRFGLVTDSHYADNAPAGTRYYRESLAKMREAVERLRTEKAAFLAHLGDIKDMVAREPDTRTLAHLAAIEAEIQKFGGPTYHVLGNHDMDNLSKTQALAHLTNTGIAKDKSYYAFSQGGVCFIVLDACHLPDGRDYDHGNFDWRKSHIPPAELDWLGRELAAAREPVIVLAHQRLDADGQDATMTNSREVRAALEKAGKVLAVFTGHDHPGGYSKINGIHYYTQKAMVEGSGPESNAYTLVEVAPEGDITVTGYRKAVGRKLDRASKPATKP